MVVREEGSLGLVQHSHNSEAQSKEVISHKHL